MPAQKRSLPESLSDSDDEDPTHIHHHQRAKQSRAQDEYQLLQEEEKVVAVEENEENGEEEEEEEHDRDEAGDSEGSPSSTSEEKPEFLFVQLPEIRKDVHCPICLGIIKKTRTVMECLHRFCRECIDKSMRMGNNECPACRTHCASRRSLRDDPNYDALIAALYPDIEKYEEEELAFHEEERTRNEQLDVHLMLISLDKRCTPSLQQPHLCCRPSLSVKHLCDYVSRQTPLLAEEVEFLAVKGYHSSNDEKLTLNPSSLMNDLDSSPLLVDPCRYDLQILQAEETLGGVKAICTSSRDHLILAYRRKEI